MGGWVGEKKTKLMLYSTLVEIQVEVGVELGNYGTYNKGEEINLLQDFIYLLTYYSAVNCLLCVLCVCVSRFPSINTKSQWISRLELQLTEKSQNPKEFLTFAFSDYLLMFIARK